jgi:uncharacterized protein (DUF169 family)/histone H3/H4
MPDLKYISEILVTKGKVRGKPVAISLFRESIPEGYEPIDGEPCTLVGLAMDESKKVYFDADHHDCLVGTYHAGMIPGKKEIISGEYLSTTSSFFTYEGAARLKSGTRCLPPGMVKAIGAAPLNEVPEGVSVDWIVVVCNAHNASLISACRVIQDGVTPYGGFGTSLCGELFATPWHERNVVITFGDFGGRMYNRLKQDELFVIIPIEYVENLPKLLVDIKLDAKGTLAHTKPPNSKFWKKYHKNKKTDAAAEPAFTMAWDEDAKNIMKKVPEGIIDFVVENAETFAREHGYATVTMKSIAEQMEELGMDLDDMLGQQ